jgi:DNA-repair protein XRCC1
MKMIKIKKEFNRIFEDISFSLSGYVNPQRNEIRRKALKMGAKYIIDPNFINNKCTHLICCYKKTPKSEQLKGYCKIVSHKFIEDCFNNKKRLVGIMT